MNGLLKNLASSFNFQMLRYDDRCLKADNDEISTFLKDKNDYHFCQEEHPYNSLNLLNLLVFRPNIDILKILQMIF